MQSKNTKTSEIQHFNTKYSHPLNTNQTDQKRRLETRFTPSINKRQMEYI